MKTNLLIFLVFGFAIPVWAGSEVRARLESTASKVAWVDVDALVEDGHVRINLNGPMAHGAVIYDQKTSQITLVDDLNKMVIPVGETAQTALKMMGFMASSQLKSQMEGAPPSAKLAFHLVEENAQALLNGSPILGQKNVQMDGFRCDLYETSGTGGKIREVWMAPRESTGISSEDYETLWSLTRLALDLVGRELGQLGADTGSFLQGYSNTQFPVHVALYANGKISSRFKIISVNQRSLGPGPFDAPASYQTVGLMDLIQQGMKGNN
jgi:hypothetical protein